jgi:hypothetical protein
MLPKLSLPRRGLLAGCALVCVVAFAAPASAGPLCTGGDNLPSAGATAVCRNFSSTEAEGNARFFLFDADTGFDHLVRITVNNVLEDFGLRLVRNLIPQGPIPGFPDYDCVPYGLTGMCVEYTTEHPQNPGQEYHPVEGEDYEGPVVWLVSWLQPVGIDPIPEIFHEFGTDDDHVYDEIMDGVFFSADLGPEDFDCDASDSTEGSPTECDTHAWYDDGDEEVCVTCYLSPKYGDPVRVSTSDTFSSAQVGIAAPEPTTAALLAIMGAGYAVRLRRRR